MNNGICSKLAGLEAGAETIIISDTIIKKGGTYIIGDVDEMGGSVELTLSFPETLTTKVEFLGNDYNRGVFKNLHPAQGILVYDQGTNTWVKKMNEFYAFNGTLSIVNGVQIFLSGTGYVL